MEIQIDEYLIRIAVVRLHSRIDAFTAPQLRERLQQLEAAGTTRFIIDLSAVPFLDSAGMAVLVSLLKRARQAGGDVTLVWPDEEAARRILRLTKFDRVFRMADDVATALESA